MLSPESLAAYRRMRPSERLALSIQAIGEAQKYLVVGSHEVVERRFARIRQENDARNRQMLTRLAAADRNMNTIDR
jgi:hypothetical protein